MARWDEILTLPVQNPTVPEFSAADISWSRVEGWKGSVDRIALIPFSRVADFVKGESSNPCCPTKFHVEARRKRPAHADAKVKVDGILEYILYWCSFGPDDHRKGGSTRPSRNISAKRKSPAGRPNTKRGCVCHFIVKRLIAEPSVALIIYNQDQHLDKKGLPCHGPMDEKATGTRAMFAPDISDGLRLEVTSLLHAGVPVETIMQRHDETVDERGGPQSRDDLLTHRFVRRLERKIRRSTHELDPDDAASVGIWADSHRDLVFIFEDFSDSDTFVLGIQSEWQLGQMIRFGNRNLLLSDSKFGSNKLKYPIHSILALNLENEAVPVAWILSPSFAASCGTHRWMTALRDRAQAKDPTFQLAGFVVDDPSTDVNTIREVFQCSVMLSFWRARHAWHKNLVSRCLQPEVRATFAKQLGDAVSAVCRGIEGEDAFAGILEEFNGNDAGADFAEYFKATWIPRLGAWARALMSLPYASTEVAAALETYHYSLKVRFFSYTDLAESSGRRQRVDWAAERLATTAHSYFWLDNYAGRDELSHLHGDHDEWARHPNPWRLASAIPDSDVTILNDGHCAIVQDQQSQREHSVLNPGGSPFAVCNCEWSMLGYICQHAVKSAAVWKHSSGEVGLSTTLLQYNQALTGLLHSLPEDGGLRDHAIALAVRVQEQLTANAIMPPRQASADQRELLIEPSGACRGFATGSITEAVGVSEGS